MVLQAITWYLMVFINIRFLTISPWFPQDFPKIPPKISPRYPQDIPKICPIYAQDIHVYTRYAQDIPKEIPKIFSLDWKLSSAVVYYDFHWPFILVLNFLYLQVCIFSPYWWHTVLDQEVRLDKYCWRMYLWSLNSIIHKCIMIRDLKKCGFVMFSLYWALG